MEFGNRLKELRHLNHLTQTQLAERIGVAKSAVSYYENGERCPSHDVLIRIARIFHVSTDYLLGVERKSTLDTSGLTSSQIQILEITANEFRKKNENII